MFFRSKYSFRTFLFAFLRNETCPAHILDKFCCDTETTWTAMRPVTSKKIQVQPATFDAHFERSYYIMDHYCNAH